MDLDFVRSQFPALAGEWVFFDNAGGSQTLKPVARRIEEYLLGSNVQLGASYDVSEVAGARVDAAAEAMATYVNAADPSEVVMGPSTSMLLRTLALCLGETFAPGDEIIVTNCDHEANIGPWVELAERRGLTLRTWRVNPETWEMDIDDLRTLLTERTRLVALTHASNILGGINPIKDIAAVAHEAGAMVCVDGVAFAPHRRIDVQDLDVDFYAFSFYKVYGPHYALLYGKKDLLLNMPGMNHFFITNDEVPYKFQPGNVNYELSYGMLGLIDYIDAFAAQEAGDGAPSLLTERVDLVFDHIARHEETLTIQLLDYLRSKSRVNIVGKDEPDRSRRVPTVSFVIPGRRSDEIVFEVDKYHIGTRFGDFYARRLIDEMGLSGQQGVVRVSMVHYNTTDELNRLLRAFDEIL